MKKFLILLSTVLMVFGLASCTKEESTNSTTKSETTPSSTSVAGEALKLDESMDINISFWHTMGKTGSKISVLQQGIADFEKQYPNIKVEEKSTGGGYDDLRDQIISGIQANKGEYPNVAYCYPDHVAMYNRADKTVQLDKYINDEKYGFSNQDIADFVPAFYDEGKSFGDGKMYLLPFSKSTELFYYNKTEFEKNKWEVPTTWTDLWALCKTIKETYKPADDSVKVVPFAYDSEANWFISMCEQLGTPYTSVNDKGEGQYQFDNAENQAFVADLKTQFTAGYFTTHAILNNYVNINSKNPIFMMAVSSSAGSTYHLPTPVDGKYPFEVGVATVPQANADNKKVLSQGPDIAMLKATGATDHEKEQKELASWLFMKYLTGTNFSAKFSMASGYMPVRESSKDTQDYVKWLATGDNAANIPATAAALAMDQADYYYTSPAFDGSSKAREQVETLMTQVFNGTEIDKAFKDAIANLTF